MNKHEILATTSAIEAELSHRLPATLSFLQELVSINSFTSNAEGVHENARRIIRQFAPLGFESRLAPCCVPGTGSHLILDSGGEGPVVACVAHLDTVYPPEEEARNNFKWQHEGPRIYGPGTADIKGGTALLWMVLDTLAAATPALFRSTRCILLWNAAEEVLAPDFEDVCQEVLPASTQACLLFEPGFAVEPTPDQAQSDDATGNECGFNLVRARKGSGNFRIAVTGRAAHSGNAYAQGANAVHQIARIIDRVMALSDQSRGTTVNVGVVSGGTLTNRVPHEAEAHFEVRAFDHDHYAQVRAVIMAMAGAGDVVAAADGFACQVEMEVIKEVLPWPQNAQTDALLARWQEAGRQCGARVIGSPRGGLSDGNRLWNRVPTLDGLGPLGGNLHASERSVDGTKLPEYVEPASLVPKALLNCVALQQLLLDASSEPFSH
ncbi:MAG: glutamate carboxypeptidase [Abditibacteriota bacterium]|nr:glutamate carboxypeptidase [Abditibacteriota bacterium]